VITKGNQETRSGPPPLVILCGEQIPQRDVARRHRRKATASMAPNQRLEYSIRGY
jgi:hypothetical protein